MTIHLHLAHLARDYRQWVTASPCPCRFSLVISGEKCPGQRRCPPVASVFHHLPAAAATSSNQRRHFALNRLPQAAGQRSARRSACLPLTPYASWVEFLNIGAALGKPSFPWSPARLGLTVRGNRKPWTFLWGRGKRQRPGTAWRNTRPNISGTIFCVPRTTGQAPLGTVSRPSVKNAYRLR